MRLKTVPCRFFSHLLLVLWSVGALAGAQYTAAEWLERVNEAHKNLSYEGTVIYSHGDQIQTLKVFRQVNREGERERLVSMSGPLREVVRDGQEVTCALPDQNTLVIQKSTQDGAFLSPLPKRLSDISNHYRFEMENRERIAGNSVQVISILPQDELRYGYRLWVDEATGMPLRSAMIDLQGNILEQLMFTELSLLNSVPEENLRMSLDTTGLAVHRTAEATQTIPVEESDWQLGALPGGFRLMSVELVQMPGKTHLTSHLVLSDGMAMVSIYVDPVIERGQAQAPATESQMGSMHAYQLRIDDHHVMVIGEVPRQTVKLIAAGLTRKTAQ